MPAIVGVDIITIITIASIDAIGASRA